MSPVWTAPQPGLGSDVQPVRAKVMGMRGEFWCVYTKTAYNKTDDVTASIVFVDQGIVDRTATLFVTHFLTTSWRFKSMTINFYETKIVT